ncbi:MAG: dihydrodipicolinate reductase [Rhodothermales bacterium]|nr:dihydrodipicolinate reductase [Rhodothermales bacterium]MCA0268686.1 dihydrodipicolinate reductase [Bacteroidota bacterium]
MPAPLRIALLGYGRMGQLVATLAAEAGHEIVVRLDEANGPITPERLRDCDVAVDFSVAEAVETHVAACLAAGVPLVVGTTGWNDRLAAVRQRVEHAGGGLVYGANFSIGVHVFCRVVEHAATLFERVGGYAPFLEEQHHAMKRDAPSGTALVLERLVSDAFGGQRFEVAVTRAGHIPGTHRVGFDGLPDQVLLAHTARSREGFAQGALLAAQWIVGRTGIYPFEAVMAEVLGG